MMREKEDSGDGREGLVLTAMVSGRTVKGSGNGVPTLFICFGQETQAGIGAVEDVARGAYPRASRLLVAHVIDLHKIPGLLRKVAEGVLANEHKKAVEGLPHGVPVDDYVVMLPDWQGAAVKALGLQDATKELGLVLIDGHGHELWRHQGPEVAAGLRQYLAANPL
jgi:hypothetical protein